MARKKKKAPVSPGNAVDAERNETVFGPEVDTNDVTVVILDPAASGSGAADGSASGNFRSSSSSGGGGCGGGGTGAGANAAAAFDGSSRPRGGRRRSSS